MYVARKGTYFHASCTIGPTSNKDTCQGWRIFFAFRVGNNYGSSNCSKQSWIQSFETSNGWAGGGRWVGGGSRLGLGIEGRRTQNASKHISLAPHFLCRVVLSARSLIIYNETGNCPDNSLPLLNLESMQVGIRRKVLWRTCPSTLICHISQFSPYCQALVVTTTHTALQDDNITELRF